MNSIKQGDKIVKIEVLDSPKDLFEAQAARIASMGKGPRLKSPAASGEAEDQQQNRRPHGGDKNAADIEPV